METISPELQNYINEIINKKVAERVSELENKIAVLESKSNAPKKLTILVTSNDFDRVLPAYLIAAGASSFGIETTIYFTLWGITTLRKEKKYKGKTLSEKLFTMMTPNGVKGLGLTKMNYFGAGMAMMQSMLKDHNIATLPDLIELSKSMGVKILACQMTMGLMGITEAELIDDVTYGGVACYIESADNSGINLFI